jgi:high-affinity nickel-transport protein
MARKDDSLRQRLRALYGGLAIANVVVWGWSIAIFGESPVLLSLALLAYTLGLRHAVDADHIAAIDNVTRKLMQTGQRPVGVGLFFSLGHASVVIALSVVIAATATALQDRLGDLKATAELVGIGISAAFLGLIALANGVVLAGLWRSFRRVRTGGRFVEADLDRLLIGGGIMARLCHRLFRLIGQSWHMYPLGLLFGLGFDTATEVGVVGISATQATQGLPIWSILLFPALFAAGMALVDSLDGTLMLGAYEWAFVRPVRKLYYNMTLTLMSVLIALLVGGAEVLGLLADRFSLDGPFWMAIDRLNDNSGVVGLLIAGLFATIWLASAMIWRGKDNGRIAVES